MMVSIRWFWLLAVLLVGSLLFVLSPILSPFLLAMLLAYMADPLTDRLEDLGLSRTLAVVLVFTGVSLVLLVLLLFLLPLVGHQIVRLYEVFPQFLDWLQTDVLPWMKGRLGLPPDFWKIHSLRQALLQHVGQSGDLLGSVLGQISASGMAFLAWLANLLLIPVVAFYLLRDWDVLMHKVRTLLPRSVEPVVVKLAQECHEVLAAFVRGQLMVMLSLGLIYALGLSLIGLDLGLLIGLLAGLASIVPYMGFVVGLIAALIASAFQYAGLEFYPILGVLLVFGFGQLVEGTVLTPNLVGDRIGLHPVAVIFAVLAGAQLFGFNGILMALPVAAVIMVLLRHGHAVYRTSALYQLSTPKDDDQVSRP